MVICLKIDALINKLLSTSLLNHTVVSRECILHSWCMAWLSSMSTYAKRLVNAGQKELGKVSGKTTDVRSHKQMSTL